MYWDHMTGWGWAYMVFLSVAWVVAAVVVTWALVTFLRSGASSGRSDPRTWRDILDERLAKGELDVEEYRNLRAAMDDPVSPSGRVPQG